ncbi:bifunctional diguanylate cyclase/phosphodiesterase [Rhodoferax sp.]|uniref:sensor domain-containing protein n=1 Tax=Rhodoferax sp. TaxID=50421 RepID=UPI001EB93C10|nr:sensor domain-containing diguanylate cyclase [Rhodoferax sp.]MBU4018418.1 PAS domain S-box protein [Gammaproteobacteria bacterium]MBU4170355.1 PAS domain S-box protein [Gammaproteobacteria bacterium]
MGASDALSPQGKDLSMPSTERERQLWAQLANSRAWVEPIEECWESELHEGSVLEQVQSKLKLQQLVLDAVSQGVLIADAQGHILSANAAFLSITGYREAEILGRTCRFLQGPLTDMNTTRAISQAFKDGLEFAGEILNYRKDETLFWNELTISPVRDGQGRLTNFIGVTRDITERKGVDTALQESEALKLAILNSVAAAIAVLDREGTILVVNEAWRRSALQNASQLGQPAPHTEVGANYLSVCQGGGGLSADDDGLKSGDGIRAVLDGSSPGFDLEYPCHSPSEKRWFSMSVTPLESKGLGAVVVHTNITARRQIEARLTESESHLRTIIENEPECIKIMDAQGRLLQMNPAGLAMVEADSLDQVLGRPVLELIAPEFRPAFADLHQRVIAGETVQMEFKMLGLKGGHRWLETHAVPMREQGGTVHLAVTRDITGRKQIEDQVRQLAFYDPLTQLPNRRLLNDRLGQAMIASKRSARYSALLFLDLDNFKALNDVRGHAAGDLLLNEASERLKRCVRAMDTVARFGGDEFVVVLNELDVNKTESTERAKQVAEKIRVALGAPYLLTLKQPGKAPDRVEHHCTASIGVVLFINHEASQEDLLKWADAAMYQAKDAGRNRVQFYDPTAVLA